MKETEILFAERLFPNFDNIKYVEWAISLMEKGFENENLYILAGLENDDTPTREKYFTKVITELNCNINDDKTFLLDCYAIHVAMEVMDEKISAFKGLEIFDKIISMSNHDRKYSEFSI